MQRFKKILVGVDLANDDQLVSDALTNSTNSAIDNAIWLAKQNEAQLLFFHAVEIPGHARFAAEMEADLEEKLLGECEDLLKGITQRAKAEGVAANYSVAIGKGWVEIIRNVLKKQADLVITGTHRRGTTASVLFGSTGMKLLRKCPCPVWITKPPEHERIKSILVTDDLSPVGDLALELGASMASLHGAELHVLHVLELGLGRPQWDSYEIRKRARAEASQKLEEQFAKIQIKNLQEQPHVDIVVDAADAAIIQRIQKYEIDLIVMGTVARGGISGVLVGNTAERLLPQIPCSILAVKPNDFVCPIDF